jgi:thioredoxin reductase (NADPH)
MRAPVVVVGAGPAGCAAAIQLARLRIPLRLLDASGRAGGLVRNAFLVENYPGLSAPCPGERLARRLAADLRRLPIAVDPATVRSIAQGAKGFVLATNRGLLEASAVVLATGTRPRRLGVPGEADLWGDRVRPEIAGAAIERGMSVVVIGAGEAAFDYATSAAARGAQVTVLMRGEGPKARGRVLERALGTGQVMPVARVAVEALTLAEDQVELTVRGGPGRLCADLVLVAVGREPSLPERLGNAGEAQGLFVIGDARLGGLGQVGIAVGDGLYCSARIAKFATPRRAPRPAAGTSRSSSRSRSPAARRSPR